MTKGPHPGGARPSSSLGLSDEQRVELIDDLVERSAACYRQWSRSAKLGYRWLNAGTIFFSASVPVIVLLPPLFGVSTSTPWVPGLAGIFGAAATFAKSIDSLLKNHETWLRNDAALNVIATEQNLFRERAGPYRGLAQSERIELYAERVENAIGSQVQQWTGAETAAQGHSA